MIIWNLAWKDDSFRTVGDGDFVYISPGETVYRPIYPPVVPTNVFKIDVRARYVGQPASLGIQLYDATGTNVIFSTSPLFDINGNTVNSINSSQYAWYTTGGPIQVPASIGAISLIAQGNYEIDVDYVCLATSDSIDLGGSKISVQVRKKTPVIRIPNNVDVIQQLGISSRTEVLTFPKVSRVSYNWIEDKTRNNTPVEVVSPDFQATGFLIDAQGYTEAGWVGIGADNAPVGQLYDIMATMVKVDRDVDTIYNVNPTIPTATSYMGIHLISGYDNSNIAGGSVSISGQFFNGTKTTNTGGVALFPNIPTGIYTVTASAGGYKTVTTTVTYSGGQQTFNITLPLRVV